MNYFLRYAERSLDAVAIIAVYNTVIIATGAAHPTSLVWCAGAAFAALILSAIIAVGREGISK
jgi:hypothetical protein